jgi:hypothetical protein
MATIKYWDGTAWVLAIVGKQGPQGPTGPTGSTGSTGPTGQAYINLDGGEATSTYGGLTTIDCGQA